MTSGESTQSHLGLARTDTTTRGRTKLSKEVILLHVVVPFQFTTGSPSTRSLKASHVWMSSLARGSTQAA
jgi:hypothetical protein